ncbi:MAG: 3-phenylpropionate/cinnamic acid dioxygenase subunit beta [Alphaproteobacteria bacterium]|nr:3-phenylpropionate/cinnamic acid dioxygenase subunit beta [Alphaproteobacteria bacterium]
MNTRETAIDALLLQREIEAFYYHEAELLDDRRFEEWLDLLTPDVTYFMPLRRNVKYGAQQRAENSAEGLDAAWFDEGKHTLTQRVAQIKTGIHWAEEPLSRVRHLVTNVQIAGNATGAGGVRELEVKSRFMVYRNRVDDETDIFVGERTDRLRKSDNGWKVAGRVILLDQSTLLAKNLTVFF